MGGSTEPAAGGGKRPATNFTTENNAGVGKGSGADKSAGPEPSLPEQVTSPVKVPKITDPFVKNFLR